MTNIKKYLSISFALLFICLLCLTSIPAYSFAETTSYSDVLDDLQKDGNFNVNDYKIIENDYSLQVIQIAESENKELLIYVYQPSATHYATSINISTTINDYYSPHNYSLSFINSNGALQKYIVNEFIVSDDLIRYYDISSIFRNYDELIDGIIEDGSTISEKAFDVSKLWTVSEENGVISYDCTETKTVTITDRYDSYIRYENGFFLMSEACDSHFIAFSTDYQIDMLLEADVYFTTRSVWEYRHQLMGGEGIDYGSTYSHEVHLDRYEEVNEHVWGHSYTWNRIESVSEFIEKEDLTSTAKNNIKDKQWVLRFYESPYSYHQGDLFGWDYDKNYIQVRDVTILRLKFETEGQVFNIGVVDNKQAGNGIQANNSDNWWADLLKILGTILTIVLVVLLFSLLWPLISPFISPILTFIWKAIKYIFKILWAIISAPFKLIKSIFKKNKKE